jgi:hypothetical protein
LPYRPKKRDRLQIAMIMITEPANIPFRLWLKSFFLKKLIGFGLRKEFGTICGWSGLVIKMNKKC